METSKKEEITYQLVYNPQFASDIENFDRAFSVRIEKVIQTRLKVTPTACGKPLMRLLSGYWKLRLGDYRLIYKMMGREIWMMGILHRREVYEKILKRLSWKGPTR